MAEQKTRTKVKGKQAKPETGKAKTEKDEKEFVIPLRRKFRRTARYKRTPKAVKTVKEYIVRHMKVYDRDLKKVRLDKYLNEFLWSRGIKNPPFKISVKAVKNKDGTVKVELIDLPEKYKFKEKRIGKREVKAKEIMEQKKTATEKLKEAAAGRKADKETLEEKTKEEKKEEEEKKKAVVEAGKELKKQQAKKAKHQTKQAKSKKPKRQKRKALQK